MYTSVNKTMYLARASLCLHVITLVVLGVGFLLLREPSVGLACGTGRINVQVHQLVHVDENKSPDSFRMTAGNVTHVMREGQENNTFSFESVQCMGGIVFRVMEGPHPRAALLLLPINFKRGTHAYRISNLHIAIMTLNWVKEVPRVRK